VASNGEARALPSGAHQAPRASERRRPRTILIQNQTSQPTPAPRRATLPAKPSVSKYETRAEERCAEQVMIHIASLPSVASVWAARARTGQ